MDKLYLQNFTKIVKNNRVTTNDVNLYRLNSEDQEYYYIKRSFDTKESFNIVETDPIIEYIGSKLFKLFMREYAPSYYLIIDEKVDQLFIGSKALTDFTILQYYKEKVRSSNLEEVEEFIRVQNQDVKKPQNLEDVIFISYYIDDQDINASNIGFIRDKNATYYIKLDFDDSLMGLNESISLRNIMRNKGYIDMDRLNLDIDKTISAIQKIINCPNEDLFNNIDNSINDLKLYLADQKPNLVHMENFDELSNYLKEGLVQRKVYFDDILYGLELEKSIQDNDIDEFFKLLNDTRFANYDFYSIDEDFSGKTIVEFADYHEKYEIKEILNNYYADLNYTCIADNIIETGLCSANNTAYI